MNFEEAYKKVQAGTATAEEMQFVAREIENVRAVNSILDNVREESPVVRDVPEDTVRKAKKVFNRRTLVRSVMITLCSVLLLGVITCGILFIPSTISAKKCENFSRQEAVEQAKACVSEYSGQNADRLTVRDVDKRIYLGNGLNKAYYYYEVNLRDGGIEYEINVHAKSGYASITDIDNDYFD